MLWSTRKGPGSFEFVSDVEERKEVSAALLQHTHPWQFMWWCLQAWNFAKSIIDNLSYIFDRRGTDMYGNVAQWLVVPSIRMSLGFESQLCYLFLHVVFIL